ncbi:MAG: nitroreductase family protein [Thermoflexales bacterium]|nr:nitroreductase family protein [Thermoflexales bacterium]MDW8351011.1 nitroreductase family protein [Anaerolineae bacterium]
MDAIARRRMIRRYSDRTLPRELVIALLEAATRAPSPHNRQPWRFAVLTGNARVRLAIAMGERLREDLTRDGVAPEQIARDVARSYQRITSAPVCLLACMTLRDMDVYSDERRNAAERWMAGQAVAAALQNVLLTATDLGLGACWMCAPLFCPQTVIQTLGLPEDWQPQALITLGYPADAGKPRDRRPVDEVTIWLDN